MQLGRDEISSIIYEYMTKGNPGHVLVGWSVDRVNGGDERIREWSRMIAGYLFDAIEWKSKQVQQGAQSPEPVSESETVVPGNGSVPSNVNP